MADLQQQAQNHTGITPLYLSKLLYRAEESRVLPPPVRFLHARPDQRGGSVIGLTLSDAHPKPRTVLGLFMVVKLGNHGVCSLMEEEPQA